MDKSDLEVYQNIYLTDTGASSSSTHPNRNHVHSQVCQICGVVLKIDPNIVNMNDSVYRRLGNPFSNFRDGDLVEAVMPISSANLDGDMEISISALDELSRMTSLNSGGPGGEESSSSLGFSSKIFGPLYQKSVSVISNPRSFYFCPTSINITESTSNQASSSINVNNDLMTGWSARINATSALFDMMSSNTNIDHPLCEECADQLVNQLDAQCKVVEKELSDYTALVNRLNQQASNEKEVNDLEQELKQLEKEEQELVNKLSEAEKKETALVKLKEERLTEEANLMQQEQTHLLEYSNYKRQLIKLEEKQESLDNQLQNSKFHFNRLRTVNVLNATFHIWHSGPFGTINYFRLGRLPGTPVEWEEINAGLGQVNLLLYCLARKVKLEFKRYRLVPFGSFSYIQVTENTGNHKQGDQLNMYRLKGYKYYFDWDSKFDQSMIAFLDCLNQFEEKIKSMDPQFSMPYRINGYKLEDKNSSSYSIRCQFNSHEEWTKALKYMLTNLKWSLVWVSAINENAA